MASTDPSQSPNGDADPVQPVVALLQQINTTLSGALQQQNDRLERLEHLLSAGNENQSRTPETPQESNATNPQLEASTESNILSVNLPQPVIKDEAPLRPPGIPKGPREPEGQSIPGAVDLGGQQQQKSGTQEPDAFRAPLPPSFPAAPMAPSRHSHSYLDPSPTEGGKAFFETHPEVEAWLKSKLWVPSDRRVPLAFDVDTLNAAESISEIKQIGSRLHKFHAGIIPNFGRFTIMDHFIWDRMRVWGNDINDIPVVRHRPADNSRSVFDFAAGVISTERLKPTLESAVMTWPNNLGDSSKRIVPPSCPWRRSIIIEGVGEIISKDLKDHRAPIEGFFSAELSASPANPLLTHLGSRVSRYVKRVIEEVRTPLIQNPLVSTPVAKHLLHYSWFKLYGDHEVRQSRHKEKGLPLVATHSHDCFRAGRLYGDTQGRWLGRRSTTLQLHHSILTPNWAVEEMKAYTILVIRPPTERNSTSDSPDFVGQVSLIHHSALVMEQIHEDLRPIAEYLEAMLDIGDDVLYDPNEHDRLLFDDDTFSSSRKYWWAMDMLSTIRNSLDQCILAHNEMYNDLIWPCKRIKPLPVGLEAADNRAGLFYTNLKELLKRFDAQQVRVNELRSGLFNASAVVESRASTRLGEIVKLLTYVSIFYLPLTFSTSLWQTTTFFSNQDTSILFAVMIIIAFVTYSMTFNLDNIVQLWHWHYETVKEYIVSEMSKEGGVWEHRAYLYSGFKPSRVNSTPSEWWVLWYVLTYSFRPSHLMRIFKKKKPQGAGTHVRTNTWASNTFQQYQGQFKKPTDEDCGEWMRDMPQEPEVILHNQATAPKKTKEEKEKPAGSTASEKRTGSPVNGATTNGDTVGGHEKSTPKQNPTESSSAVRSTPDKPKPWYRRLFSPAKTNATGNPASADRSQQKDSGTNV